MLPSPCTNRVFAGRVRGERPKTDTRHTSGNEMGQKQQRLHERSSRRLTAPWDSSPRVWAQVASRLAGSIMPGAGQVGVGAFPPVGGSQE